MPWSLFFECWALSQLFHSPLSLSSRGSLVLHFLPYSSVICISEVIDIFPGNFDSTLCFIQSGILLCIFYFIYNIYNLYIISIYLYVLLYIIYKIVYYVFVKRTVIFRLSCLPIFSSGFWRILQFCMLAPKERCIFHDFPKPREVLPCFPSGLVVNPLPAMQTPQGRISWIPESGRSPWRGNGNPFQYSYWWNPKDRGAWWATALGVQQEWSNVSPNHAERCLA